MLDLNALPSAARKIVQLLPYALFMYALATLTSMAGMEIFGWLSIAMILSVLLMLVRRPVNERPPFPFLPIIDGVLIAMIVVVAVGALLSEPGGSGFVTIIGRVRWIIIFMMIRTGLTWIWSDRFSMIMTFLVGVFTVIAAYAIVQHFTGIDLIRDSQRAVPPFYYGNGHLAYRVPGLFSSPMTWGHAAAMFICYPAALYFLKVRRHSGYHRFFGASVLLIGISIVLSFTRGAWVSTAVALLVVGLLSGRRAFLSAILGLAVVGGAIYALSPDVRARVAVTFDPNYASNLERMTIWKANWEMFKDRPVIGVGYGENERLIGSYYERMGIQNSLKGHAHSNYFQWLSGTGSLGFILYMAFVLGLLILSGRLWWMIPRERLEDRAIVLGAIGSQVAMHVGGLTECNFKDAEVNHQFIFSLAVVWALYQVYAQEDGLRIVRPKNERIAGAV